MCSPERSCFDGLLTVGSDLRYGFHLEEASEAESWARANSGDTERGLAGGQCPRVRGFILETATLGTEQYRA